MSRDEINQTSTHNIFRYFALLLSNQDNSRAFSNTVIAISFLQNIGLTLQNSISLIEVTMRQPLVYIIHNLANMTTVSFWIEFIGAWEYYPYFRILTNIVITLFFIALYMVYLEVVKAKKSNSFISGVKISGLDLLKKLHTLLVPILIQHILEILLPTILCEEHSGAYFASNAFTYKCGASLPLFYFFIVLSWFQAIVCVLYIGFIAYLGFDETISKKNKLGKRNNQLDFWVMFGKIYLVIWNIFVKSSKFTFGIYFVSYFLISVHEIMLAMEHVFFDFEMYKFFLTFFFFEKGVFVSFSVMNMLEFKLFNFDLAVVVLIFVLIFMGRFASNLAHKVSMEFLNITRKSRSGQHAPELDQERLMGMCGYLSCYEQNIADFPRAMSEGVQNRATMEFINSLVGVVRDHVANCKKFTCFCKRLKRLPNPKDNSFEVFQSREELTFNKTFLKYFVKNLLETNIKKLAISQSDLRLCLIDHLFKNMEHIHSTIINLHLIFRHIKDLQKRYRVFKIKEEISLFLARKNQNVYNIPWMSSFDIESISKLEKNFYKMRAKIVLYKEHYVEFLDLVLTPIKSDLNKLESKHQDLMKIEKRIEEIFLRIKDNPRSIRLYMEYKNLIKDEKERIPALVKKMEKLRELANMKKTEARLLKEAHLMFDEDTALIQIGALKENMSLILSCNPGAEKLTGYSKSELMGVNINILMPKPYSSLHQSFLMNFYKTGVSSILYKEQKTFIKHKTGYLKSIHLLVKPLFDNANNDFCYISYLQSADRNMDYILLNTEGAIIGVTQNITEYFGWIPRDFDRNAIYIQNIIPAVYETFATIFLYRAVGNKVNYEKIVEKIDLKKNMNGFFRAECFNNKLPIDPYPDKRKFSRKKILDKSKMEQLKETFERSKETILNTCHNLINKYEIEFKLRAMQVGNHNKCVFVMKISNYMSLGTDLLKPIKSYYCRKICRFAMMIIRFRRLLKTARKVIEERRAQELIDKMRVAKGDQANMFGAGYYPLLANEYVEVLPDGDKIPLIELVTVGVVSANLRAEQENEGEGDAWKLAWKQRQEKKIKMDRRMRNKTSDEDDRRKEMLKLLQEGSINSASNARGTNMRMNVRNSIRFKYVPTSFQFLRMFSLFLIMITFIATQLLLVYQTIYFKSLRKSLNAQNLLLKFETTMLSIVHHNSYLYLLETQYKHFDSNLKFNIVNDTVHSLDEDLRRATGYLKELKSSRFYIGKEYEGGTLQGYLSRETPYYDNSRGVVYRIGFLESCVQIIRASFDLKRFEFEAIRRRVVKGRRGRGVIEGVGGVVDHRAKGDKGHEGGKGAESSEEGDNGNNHSYWNLDGVHHVYGEAVLNEDASRPHYPPGSPKKGKKMKKWPKQQNPKNRSKIDKTGQYPSDETLGDPSKRSYDYIFDQIFNNTRAIQKSIFENMKIDPYSSFLKNTDYVIYLILTSLVLNTMNGIAIIIFLYKSLHYLDKVYHLVMSLPYSELKTLRNLIDDQFNDKTEEIDKEEKDDKKVKNDKNDRKNSLDEPPQDDSSFEVNTDERDLIFSKDFIKIKKPMIKLSSFIFLTIFILSGFYLLSLWALGFFSGEGKILLRLKKKVYTQHVNLHVFSFDVMQFLFEGDFGYTRERELSKRLARFSSSIRLSLHDIDMEVLGVSKKKLIRTIDGLMTSPICEHLDSGVEYFGYDCVQLRDSILGTGELKNIKNCKFLFV